MVDPGARRGRRRGHAQVRILGCIASRFVDDPVRPATAPQRSVKRVGGELTHADTRSGWWRRRRNRRRRDGIVGHRGRPRHRRLATRPRRRPRGRRRAGSRTGGRASDPHPPPPRCLLRLAPSRRTPSPRGHVLLLIAPIRRTRNGNRALHCARRRLTLAPPRPHEGQDRRYEHDRQPAHVEPPHPPEQAGRLGCPPPRHALTRDTYPTLRPLEARRRAVLRYRGPLHGPPVRPHAAHRRERP